MNQSFQSSETVEGRKKSPDMRSGLSGVNHKTNNNKFTCSPPRSQSPEHLRGIEQSLLDALIRGDISFDKVETSGLRAEDFSSEIHRLVFEAMKRLYSDGRPIEVQTLHNELDGTLRPDGGAWSVYIMNVLGTALPLGSLEYHVGEIREASRLRKLSEAGYRLHEAAQRREADAVREWRDKIAELQAQEEVDTGARCITLANHDPKPKPWVIEGLIPDGFPSTIYGAGGIGKSFLSVYLGIEACRGGQSFMGHAFPEDPLNTLIIDYELDADIQTKRARTIARGQNLAGIPENLHYYAPAKSATRALLEFRGLIKRHGIRFVIIDSWGGSGVDGGNPEDTTAFLTELRNLGIATLMLDHQSKTQTGESYDNKTAYGSVYKFNMCRSVFQLSKIGESKNPMTLRLRHKKSNFGPEVDDLVFDVHFQGDRVLFTESSSQTPEDRDLGLIAEAIAELEASGARVNQKALAEYLKGTLGRDRLHSLLKKGEGGLWEISPGDRREKLYKSKILKNGHIYNQDFRILENTAEDIEDGDYPEVIAE